MGDGLHLTQITLMFELGRPHLLLGRLQRLFQAARLLVLAQLFAAHPLQITVQLA
ncbi:hypothetical protein D3C87_1884840 [compost metagenome]